MYAEVDGAMVTIDFFAPNDMAVGEQLVERRVVIEIDPANPVHSRFGLADLRRQVEKELQSSPMEAFVPQLGSAMQRLARPGKRGWDDLEYARIARDYVKMVAEQPTRPTKALAELRHASVKTAEQWVYRARERGLLTAPPVPRGRGGGQLTEKALGLLERDERWRAER